LATEGQKKLEASLAMRANNWLSLHAKKGHLLPTEQLMPYSPSAS
jgi:hypothetical protein